MSLTEYGEREWLDEALNVFMAGRESASAPQYEHLAALVVYGTELEEALVREGILPEDTVGPCTVAFAAGPELGQAPWDEYARKENGKLLKPVAPGPVAVPKLKPSLAPDPRIEASNGLVDAAERPRLIEELLTTLMCNLSPRSLGREHLFALVSYAAELEATLIRERGAEGEIVGPCATAMERSPRGRWRRAGIA